MLSLLLISFFTSARSSWRCQQYKSGLRAKFAVIKVVVKMQSEYEAGRLPSLNNDKQTTAGNINILLTLYICCECSLPCWNFKQLVAWIIKPTVRSETASPDNKIMGGSERREGEVTILRSTSVEHLRHSQR